MYDVIIIGSGPAGTAAGYDLARSGYSVLIMDRHSFPRKKACAGGVTPKALDLYPYDISKFILRTCRQVRVIDPGGRSFFITHKRPLCYMVQRTDLDSFALGKARAAGAAFTTIDRIVTLLPEERQSAGIEVEQTGERCVLKARFIIGADGANSTVRRLLDRACSHPSVSIIKLPALEADVRVKDPGDFPMTFDFSMGIPGYYWIFPKDDHVNIGIFSARPHVPMDRSLLAGYAEKILENSCLSAVKGYPIACTEGRISALPGAGRVLLVGDAGGFAEPLLGEGIYSALKTGHLAASAVKNALCCGHGSALSSYHHSLARLRMDLRCYRHAAGVMYRFPDSCLRALPMVHRPFTNAYACGHSLFQTLWPF